MYTSIYIDMYINLFQLYMPFIYIIFQMEIFALQI